MSPKKRRPSHARYAQRSNPFMPYLQKIIFLGGLLSGMLGTYSIYVYYINPNWQLSISPKVPKLPALTPPRQKVKRKANAPEPPPQLGPRYDFYNMLTSFELAQSPQEDAPKAKGGTLKSLTPIPALKAKSKAVSVTRTSILIQAGPFSQLSEAERLKKKLKSLSNEIAIHGIRLKDGSLGFRLSIGPLDDDLIIGLIKKQIAVKPDIEMNIVQAHS